MSFQITLQNILNFTSTHADLLPLSGIGGYTNEPGLSICNDALSDLITDPNDWKCNRNELPLLVTCPQKQDYLFAGACAFSLGSTSQGWAIDLASSSAITVSAGVVTVNTIEAHRFAVGDTIYLNNVTMTTGTASAYNSIFTDTGAMTSWSQGYVITTIGTKSFTFAAGTGQNNADVGGAPGIFNFGYGTSGSMVQMINTSSPQYSQEMTFYREQPVTSMVSNPEKVAMMSDNGAGTLKIRFYRAPGSTTWGVKLVYQAQAPVKQSLGDTWAPFPDHYSALYRQAVVYRMYRWLNSPKAEVEYQKLQQEITKIQAFDDTEETSVSLKPESPIMDSGDSWWGW
jgi:hypothetical protein